MENKQQDPALQAQAEANRDKHMNYLEAEERDANTNKKNEESIEDRRKKHDADSGNDGSSNEMMEKEIRIDLGNVKHHHSNDADENIFDDEIDCLTIFEIDTGG